MGSKIRMGTAYVTKTKFGDVRIHRLAITTHHSPKKTDHAKKSTNVGCVAGMAFLPAIATAKETKLTSWACVVVIALRTRMQMASVTM